ncbi:hypothetical protein GCM10011391_33260 [Pullulanibacillus camelliae]|uniref:MurNAc-LAA domain-containing protein n=1 Tax=Pullulanibacillus camelliae TaxID=1707096 RepID=A0A8J3E0P9_9BACL|nr:N-acetylmuramoyl-L-alanine amidase [Pullulanibacillus camelliae]GGE51817.1 hypothetical protein GCM10011391_33260 [Pullulanibacillus camelliae]
MRKRILIGFVIILSLFLLGACGNDAQDHFKRNGNMKKEDHQTTEVFKVVIDPGHGGQDKGTTGADGRYEKDFTLSLGKKVEGLLKKEQGIKVYMTREDDDFISQTSRYRPNYANKLNADLYISIHANAFTDSTVSGTQTYYYHAGSQAFAKILQKHIAKATGFPDRGVKKEDLFVVKDTKMPAALVEVGYLTNPHDEAKMFADNFQKHIADSMVNAIKEYKSQSSKKGFFL